jgi:hypothetical protein
MSIGPSLCPYKKCAMKLKPALLLGVLWLMATACQPQAGFVSSAGPAEDYIAVTRAQLADQLSQWRAQKFHHYNITYEFVEDTTTPAVVTRRTVQIRNNSVLDTRCAASACPTTFLKDLRFVLELFDLVASLPAECIDQVQFNRDYHFPEFISANCASDYPKPFTIRVAAFLPDS